MAGLGAKFQALQTIIQNNMKEDSAKYKAKIEELRAKAYGGCAACVVFPPSCIPCYATAAGLLEGKYIPELKQQCQDLQNQGQQVINVMQNLSTSAETIRKGAEDESQSLKLYSGQMQSQCDNITRFQQMTSLSNPKIIWDLIKKHLQETVTDCDTLLNKLVPPTQ